MLAGANNLSLKSLTEALEVTIVVDSREQDPLPFTRFKTVSGNLLTGDYSVLGLESWFSIERKIDRGFGRLLRWRKPRAL
jgi:hypothetical protein